MAVRASRGQIGWFRLNPVRGNEQNSTGGEGLRPCVVLSDTQVITSEGYFLLYVAVPLTTKLQYESRICPRIANPNFNGVTQYSLALIPQIRALDPERLERVGRSALASADLNKLEVALRLLLGLQNLPVHVPPTP